jgi:hypothetical protein
MLLGVTTATTAHAEEPERTEEEKLHTARIEELSRRIEEEQLRGRYEQIVRDNEAHRREPADVPTGGIENRRILLPNILGVSVNLGGLAPGAVGGSVGPLSVSASSTSLGSTRLSTQGLSFAPSLDVILGRRWTVGGTLVAQRWTHRQESEPQASSMFNSDQELLQLGVEPRVGLLIPLGNRVLLWPQLSVAVNRGRSENRTTQGPDGSMPMSTVSMTTGLGASASASVLFPLSRYVYASFNTAVGYRANLVEEQDKADEGFSLRNTAGIGLSF